MVFTHHRLVCLHCISCHLFLNIKMNNISNHFQTIKKLYRSTTYNPTTNSLSQVYYLSARSNVVLHVHNTIAKILRTIFKMQLFISKRFTMH